MALRCNKCLQYYDATTVHNCRFLKNYTSLQDFLLVYECARCSKPFTGLSNAGMHQCRYHPGDLGRDGKYTCCGGGRSKHTSQKVHNMVWSRRGQPPPLLINLHAGCTPCDHWHEDSAVKLPLNQDDPNRIHLLAHLEPEVTKRPGWDGKRLWPHPTYTTAEYQVQEENRLLQEANGDENTAGYKTSSENEVGSNSDSDNVSEVDEDYDEFA